MTKAKVAPTEEHTSYTIRNIDRELWQRARIKAIEDGSDMRAVILGLLRAYVAGKAEPKF